MTHFTILGGSGFIGGHLGRALQLGGHSVYLPARDDNFIFKKNLGHVFYAIGLTGDFRERPFDTVEAHVTYLSRVLRDAQFDTLLYFSSTRVYGGLSAEQTANENAILRLKSSDDALYDLSKLTGESLCLALRNPKIRIARLSNVYGMGQSKSTFLQMVLDRLSGNVRMEIGEAPESTKDYVAIEDVISILPQIAIRGRDRIYNVASGRSISHKQLSSWLRQLTGKSVAFAEGAPCRTFPNIDVERVGHEFGWHPRELKNELARLLAAKQGKNSQAD